MCVEGCVKSVQKHFMLMLPIHVFVLGPMYVITPSVYITPPFSFSLSHHKTTTITTTTTSSSPLCLFHL